MAAKYRVISLLMITILLLANSGSMWKISPTEERSRKIPDMYPVKAIAVNATVHALKTRNPALT
ncbi:uncharacterized protein LOC142587849 isoform X5 [Dermacentor variabilis]|uniref:uncharacterized protein LOC142587849 isoform X5 n=1 Tax=Dermacentor variabilis TaxID=34621 RepID=UPI003F5C1A85